MRQIRFHQVATETDPSFREGVESVVYLRCMEHRASEQINQAESNEGECGECIRQQCWKDIFGLIEKCIEATPNDVTGKEALILLRESLRAGGICTFGVANELEKAYAAARDTRRQG